MKCLKCKNKGFIPTEDLKQPLVNLGGKRHFDTFNQRSYTCTDCGFTFYTVEKYDRPMGNHTLDDDRQEGLFSGG